MTRYRIEYKLGGKPYMETVIATNIIDLYRKVYVIKGIHKYTITEREDVI